MKISIKVEALRMCKNEGSGLAYPVDDIIYPSFFPLLPGTLGGCCDDDDECRWGILL